MLSIVQITIAALLMLSILLQNRGGGLSGIFGGEGNVYMTKRGFEKKLFYATIVLAVLFFTVSFLNFML
jgi:protein translocase SecG subunit